MRTWPALTLTFPGSDSLDGASPTLQDLVSAELDSRDVVAIAEQSDRTWQVCFGSDARRATAAARLDAAFGPGGLIVTAIDMVDDDWARRSQASLGAVRAGNIVVTPPWDPQATVAVDGITTIVIEPAMGFGSGHHATTRLCLTALQRLDLHGRRVLDVGTGSGVLALAAARLGATAVLAIDVDPDALDNARLNAGLNGHPAAVEFREMDFRHEAPPSADVVVANLTGGMLAAGAPDVLRAVAAGGALILSGITLDERAQVLAAFEEACTVEWTAEEDGWVAALLRPTS
jgi:ribosomal protein L11 methyltransferase